MITNENLTDFFKTPTNNYFDYDGAMFFNIFKQAPMAYCVYYDKDKNNKLTYKPFLTAIEPHKHIDVKQSLYDFITKVNKDTQKNPNLKLFSISSHEWYIVNVDENLPFMINYCTIQNKEDDCYFQIVYTTEEHIQEVFKYIKKWIVPVYTHDDPEFGIAAINKNGNLYTSWYEYPYKEISIEDNYNDDIPYDKMCELIEKEKSSELMLFYGEPGTGKSSLIKHFICKYPDVSFIIMDGSLLASVSQEILMSYFLDNENTIFILEDCEKSLMNRDNNYNPVMPVLLNLTDGIIGDVLGIKLICTFNTALSNIDKALLRKGRLSLKYEFKALDKEKVKKILHDDNISKDMTLADIYNVDEENDFSKKKTSRIGF